MDAFSKQKQNFKETQVNKQTKNHKVIKNIIDKFQFLKKVQNSKINHKESHKTNLKIRKKIELIIMLL